MFTLDDYAVYLFHRPITYGPLGSCWTMAQIVCRGEGKKATLVFYDPERTAAVPNDRGGDNSVIFIPANQYPWHVDLLRHEKPILLEEDSSKWWFGSLRTRPEPTGEGGG